MAGAELGRYDVAALRESRNSYAAAHTLNEYDLYPALNVARLDILLSKWERDRLTQGQNEFANEIDLCRHEVRKSRDDWWRRFDLAERFCSRARPQKRERRMLRLSTSFQKSVAKTFSALFSDHCGT
jgi:hypothetical protein